MDELSVTTTRYTVTATSVCDSMCAFGVFMQEFGLQQLQEGSAQSTFRSFLCNMLLLCYHTFMSFILGKKSTCTLAGAASRKRFYGGYVSSLTGTGEGDVEDAEKLLQPYLKKYPKVCLY